MDHTNPAIIVYGSKRYSILIELVDSVGRLW